jgi:hypothetical protein
MVARCSSCLTVAMFLSAGGSEWCTFVLGASQRIYETAKYEPAKSEG